MRPKSAWALDTCPKCDQKVWTLVQNATKKCLNIGYLSKMWPKSLDTCQKCVQKVWTLVQNEIKKFGHFSKMWPWGLDCLETCKSAKKVSQILNLVWNPYFFNICGPWHPWLAQFNSPEKNFRIQICCRIDNASTNLGNPKKVGYAKI